MERTSMFSRSYKKIGTVFLLFVGFFVVFFSVSRTRDSALGGHSTLTGVAHADVPVTSSASGDSSGDGDGGGDSGDSGGK